MAYQKQNFVDGKPLSAAELNRMEDGIAAAMEAGGGNVPGGGTADLTGYAKESWVQENYQPKGDYPLRSELPSVPVQSVNGKTGAVKLTAEDVSARPSSWTPTAADVGALPNTYKPPNQTAQQVGADPAGTAANAVSGHNSAADAHADIRLQMTAINDRLKAFFDSDDQTLDELSEIVAYITSNKSLIDAITTSKVSVLDIVNDLVTNVPAKPLSAAQGVALKSLIDDLSTGKLDAAKLTEAINTALAQAKESGEFDGKVGYTPVRGIDYWTEADQEAIVQQVITALGTPVFGRVEEGNKITLSIEHLADGTYYLGYENKDGNWVKLCEYNHSSAEEPAYTNVLPLAIDSDNTPYNGGQGWKTGYRLNSSSVEKAEDGMEVTGFIPVKQGDIVRFANIEWPVNSGVSANKCYVCLYGSLFDAATTNSSDGCFIREIDGRLVDQVSMDSNGNMTEFTIDAVVFPNVKYWENVIYMRVSAYDINSNSIITINEEIT